jgi:hypothetical protein
MSTTSVEDDQALAGLAASLGFSWAVMSAPDPSKETGSSVPETPAPAQLISGSRTHVKQKR